MKWINRKDREPDPLLEHILVWNEIYGPYVLQYEAPDRWNDGIGSWVTDEFMEADFTWWLPVTKPPCDN